jgi:hypothetical protein
MRDTLCHPACRSVFIEVHFFIFARERRNRVPNQIEKLLEDCGFSVSWVDQSHIHAFKEPNPRSELTNDSDELEAEKLEAAASTRD